jgi:Protein of unknown function (DUF2550)
MLIALLAVLGVDLAVIVVLLGAVLARRRWVSRQPGAFKGAIRVVQGEMEGLTPKWKRLAPRWKRGYGRWVRDVLVWTKAPFLFRTELVAADGLDGDIRAAAAGEVKRIGDDPVVVPLAFGDARVEVAAARASRAQALGPYAAAKPD